MPTVDRIGPYRLAFFSLDLAEPPHIHVIRDRSVAKFWLQPVALAKNKGFGEHELNRIERLVVEREVEIISAWHDHFGV